MRVHVLTISAGLLLAVCFASPSVAGPPMTGSAPSAGSKWIGALNPTNWKMPSMPWTTEKPRIQKKAPSVMSNVNKSAKTTWTKTKRALDPTRMFPSSEKAKTPSTTSHPASSQSKESEGGYFSGLFRSEEPKEIRTVNDFLSQPTPQ
jgi:hypothetical protein